MSPRPTSAKSQPKKSSDYDPARGAAVLALTSYEQGEASYEEAVANTTSMVDLDDRQRRFFLRLVNGVTKMRRRLDYQLRFYLARPSEKLPLRLQNILRLGLYQLQYVDTAPDSAVANESVKLTKYFYGEPKSRLVNAILRAWTRQPNKTVFPALREDPVKHFAEMYSFPDYFVEYCIGEFDAVRTEKLLADLNEPPSLTIRVNLLKAKPEEIEEYLTNAGVTFAKSAYLDEFYTLEDANISTISELLQDGRIYIQDQSAGMAVRLLNPRPGMNALDLCAAPGGKTTYMASRMRGKGKITAVDKSRPRLELLVSNAEKMKIKIISPVIGDAVQFTTDQLFDRVIVDPPCSGWGTAKRHPELRWEKTPKDIQQMNKIQKKLLETGARLLKPGGLLVYSTCTIMRSENDQIVEEFLAKNNEFELESGAEFFDKTVITERGFVKTYPAIPKLDGAFAARIKRKPN